MPMLRRRMTACCLQTAQVHCCVGVRMTSSSQQCHEWLHQERVHMIGRWRSSCRVQSSVPPAMSLLATAFVWCFQRPRQPRRVCRLRLPLQQLQLLQTQLRRERRQQPQQTQRRQHPPTAPQGSLSSLGIPRQQRRLAEWGPRRRQHPLQQPLPHLVMLPQLRCRHLQRQVRQAPTNTPCIVIHTPCPCRKVLQVVCQGNCMGCRCLQAWRMARKQPSQTPRSECLAVYRAVERRR